MVACGNLRLLPRKAENWDFENEWQWPNFHWWILYQTLFKLCKWMYWDGWRPFCDWTGGQRRSFPWIARVIQRIGRTTAGCAIHDCECFHCGSEEGNQVHLANDETGKTFKLEETWTCATADGTDHCFRGTTFCPVCGFEAEYSDGSL
jgi:hypothetical protein